MEDEKETIEMPMKYYEVFYKVILVIELILNIIALGINCNAFNEIGSNSLGYICILGNILGNIFFIVVIIKLKEELYLKTKIAYRLTIIFLVLDYIFRVVISSLNSCLNYTDSKLSISIFICLLIYGIWFIPNLIYFIKRKNIFIEEKKTKKKERKKQITQNIKIIEKVENKKESKRDKKRQPKLPVSRKWKICAIILIVLNVGTIGLLTYEYINKLEQIETIDDLKNKVQTLTSQKNSIQTELSNYRWNNAGKISFFDNYAVIVQISSRIYHKYDCKYLDRSSDLYIFNTEYAKSERYKACPHCIK